MSAPLTPALTPDEWGHGYSDCHEYTPLSLWIDHDGGREVVALYHDWPMATDHPQNIEIPCGSKSAHALAALCLHGQPYGFTQEDVAILDKVFVGHPDYPWSDEDRSVDARLSSLASRIQALLPPSAPDDAPRIP